MIPVHGRTAATLIPIIQQYILPGTTIHSDEWTSYNFIPPSTLQHFTVKHSIKLSKPHHWCTYPNRGKYLGSSEKTDEELHDYKPGTIGHPLCRNMLDKKILRSYFLQLN